LYSIHKSKLVWSFLIILFVLAAGALTQTGPSAAAGPNQTATGVLNTIFGDPPPGSRLPPKLAFHLTEADGHVWTLNLPPGAAKAAGGPLALNGRTVRASGEVVSPNVLNVSSLNPAAGPSASPSPTVFALSGSQNFATIPCKFSDIATEQQPLSFFNDMMSNTKPGLDNYWRELSYNNINLSGSVQDNWVTLPHPQSYYFDSTDTGAKLDLLATDCAVAHDATVNFSSVVGLIIVVNGALDNCCAWGGGTTLSTAVDGKSSFAAAWLPADWAIGTAASHGVVAHESGHAFGLAHEGCQGTTSPYDSLWDPMSGARQIHNNSS
jgi:metallopeptidase family M12-like protein